MGWHILPDDLPELPCTICGELVRHGDPFYFEEVPDKYQHARCAWREVEKQPEQK